LADRSHLSIGEVLSLLREEFPDVTISKIRFLESQGLVDPERTPSGYRKFYDHDVDRLRWILRQQRENFLPLKVIRGRLSEHEEQPAPDGAAAEVPLDKGSSRRASEAPAEESDERPDGPAEPPVPRPVPESAAVRPAPATPSIFASLHAEPAEPAEAAPSKPAPAPPPEDPETYTADELAAAVGTTPALINELKQYNLISTHAVVAGTPYFDASAVAVARAAVDFARHGVEVRHLRIWRNAADRESDLFQQVVLPLLRQRNPQARRQALETLQELSRAGSDLRAALVERAIRDIR
jgi:DNA-binding transcriptional MerR regulator